MTFGMPKKPQIDKFRDAARELEADEDERKFDRDLERVAKHKPAPSEDGAPNAQARQRGPLILASGPREA
jgi:hypothetical protein